MPVKFIEKCIAELEKQKMNSRFSAPAPAPPVRSKVQGWTNYNTGPSIPRNQRSPVPPRNKRGTNCNTGPSIPRNQRSPVPARNKRGISASTPGTQLQGLSNKRARNYGPVNKFYNPQVATVNYPHNRFASQHGLGVPLNQGVARFGRPAKLVL